MEISSSHHSAWALVAVAALSIAIAGCGSGGADTSKQEIAAARASVAAEREAAQKAAEQMTEDAQQRVDDAKQEVADERDRLKSLRSKSRKASHELKQLQKQLTGASDAVARATVDGTGTYVVGEDLDPGTYRAEASPGCYWARLASLDTSDINDNDNADGPVVIGVLASDKALELKDCAEFHRVSPSE